MELIKSTRIAIDTVFFSNSYSGITKLWDLLLHNLYTLDKYLPTNTDNTENINTPITYELILLIRGTHIPECLNNIINNKLTTNITFTPIHINAPKISPKISHICINEFNYGIMFQDVDYLNYICKTHNIHYFMSTYYTYCTIIPNILMIYDMIPEIFKFATHQQWIQKDLAIKNASCFIVISKNTQIDLYTYYPHLAIAPNKYPIDLIYACVEYPIPDNKYDNTFYNDILLQTGLQTKQYIFSIITNNEKYKNIDLITQFNTKYNLQLKSLLSTKIPIVLIIKQYIPNGYTISNGILYLSNIRNEIINILYKNALCYVCTSLYEGFGLPVIEAFTHKTPVIAIHQPVFKEIAENAITFIDNNIDDLFNKITFIYNMLFHKSITKMLFHKSITKMLFHKSITKTEEETNIIHERINNGIELLNLYTPSKQVNAIHNLFNNLHNNLHNNLLTKQPLIYHYLFMQPFINIIFQSYDEKDNARRKELEYCILANLNNPYIAFIHDYNNTNNYLPESITQHPKYILCNAKTIDILPDKIAPREPIEPIELIENNKWITYKNAFKYSNNINIINKYGSYWGLINCDIFLDSDSNWGLMRGKLNTNYIFAQSRHEFNFVKDNNKDTKDTKATQITMDINFDKLLHSTTQDGWFYKAPLKLHMPVDFELGMLGCDNAIADRLNKCGYNIINQPETFKICHYDISRGKNSNNFLAIHTQQDDKQKDKQQDKKQDNNTINPRPQNKHPEREGCYLVPNYDKLLGNNRSIDLVSVINSVGGISNAEIYKVICDLFSARILINNP